MEEGPVLEDPPPPPPFPPLKARAVDPEYLASLQENVPQDFQKIVVHGKTKSPERRRRAAFKPSDQHLITARLKLFCYDKTTGKPVPNVQVQLKAIPGNDPDKVVAKTVSNAFGNRAVSRKDGFVVCKVLSGYPYRVHASASGYHDFGHMGESLTLTPQETEVVQGEVGLVPVRITVVVTLRELRPLHQPESVQRDTAGQVNPLLSMPRVDPRSGVPPQKVSFFSNEGIKMDFVATTVELEDVLVGWPATLGNTAEAASCTLGVYSTDGNGHCFFYGPKLVGRRGNGRKPREWATIDVGRWEYARKYHLRANQESPVFMLFDDFGRPVDYPAHVARYPPRALRWGSPTRGLPGPLDPSPEERLKQFLDEATKLAALASSGGSVPDPNDPAPARAPTATPTAAASVAGAPSTSGAAVGAKDGDDDAGAGVAPEPLASPSPSASQRRLDSPLQSQASKAALSGGPSGHFNGGPSGNLNGRASGGLGGNGADNAAPPSQSPSQQRLGSPLRSLASKSALSGGPSAILAGSAGAAAAVAAAAAAAAAGSDAATDAVASPSQSAIQRRLGSPLRSQASKSALAGGASDAVAAGGTGGSRPVSAVSLARSQSVPRNLRANAAAAVDAEEEGDALGHADLDAELRAYSNKIHNYLDPGQYRLQMKDPSRLLIFYTYSGDGEAAEINRAQNAVVPFKLHNADESFIHPRDGSVLRPVKFPVQLYCRARPWFQIAVYDMATLEEVGASYGLRFTIERLSTKVPGGAKGRDAEGRVETQRRRRKNALAAESDDGLDLLNFLDSEDATGGQGDSMVYPYKLLEVEEVAETLYSGMLGEIKEKLWMTPGEKYRVTVGMQSPYLEYNSVQVRMANWELEPFVFYAVKKVVMMVEVKERYNQLPVPNTEVVVEVREPPQAPRPPVVRPEWCEDPKSYAMRVVDQLLDYVVQSNRERHAVDHGPVKEYRGFTDADGLLTFELPPEAKVYVRVVNSIDFEDTECSREVQLSNNTQQFVGFQLERVTRTAVVILDAETNHGVAGFELRAYDVTDYTDMPTDGTRKVRHLLDTDMLDAIDTSPMEPFAVESTGPDGAINAPFCRRAGRVIKVEVSRTPRTHHMPALVMARGKNSSYVVTYDRQSVVFKAPPRPRIKVSCTDTCTFEDVVGVRFRIMVRPFGPPPPGVMDPRDASRRSRRISNRSQVSSSNGLPLGEPLPIPGPDDEVPATPGEGEEGAAAAVAASNGSGRSSQARSQHGTPSRPVSVAGSHSSGVGAAAATMKVSTAATMMVSTTAAVMVSTAAFDLENEDATLMQSPSSLPSSSIGDGVAGLKAGSTAGGGNSRLMSPSGSSTRRSRTAVALDGGAAEQPRGAESPASGRHSSRPGSVASGSKAGSRLSSSAAGGSAGGSRVLSPSASQRGRGTPVETIHEGTKGGSELEAQGKGGAAAPEGEELAPAAAGAAVVPGGSLAPSQAGSGFISGSVSQRSRSSAGGLDGEATGKAGPTAAGSVAESTAISVLREQHRATMEEISKLEQGLSSLAAQYDAEQNDSLEGQKRQLELLLSQLKTMMMGQQERLEALLMAEEAAGLAEAIEAAAAMEEEAPPLPPPPAAMTAGAPEDDDSVDVKLTGGPAESEARAEARRRLGRHSVSIMLPTEAGAVMAAAAAVAATPSGGAGRLSPSAMGPSRSLRERLRDPTSGGGIFGGVFSSVFGVFGAGVSRVLNRGRVDGEDEEDEEEAMRRMRAAEEEMMAVFNPAPEEQEPWGRVVWDSVTGAEENDDLILDADCEVAVQIFPAWPYDPRSQMLKGRCLGHVGPPEFRFYLPRDGNAFRFWLDRDNALPGFWDEEGKPVLPYHPLARLQPMAPPPRLLAPPHPDMKLLRPAAFNTPRGEDSPQDDLLGGPKREWAPRLHLIHTGAGVVGYGGAGRVGLAPGFIGGAQGRFYGGGPTGGESFFGGSAAAADYTNYESESILPDGTRVLHRTPSAIQFDPNDSSEDINELAWQQLRLSDPSYLPLERTRLLQFLTRWGSFPHVAGGHCRACAGLERPPDTNPLLLADAPPTPRFMGEIPQVGFGVGFSAASGWSRSGAPTGNGGDDVAGRLVGNATHSIDGAPGGGIPMRGLTFMTYKSRLMPRVELSAQWVFESRPPPRPEGSAVKRCVPDRFARTHGIMNASEAVYCKSPFFTWWLPNGGGVHVTMSDGLYRDLIPLVDSVALSLEYMDAHLDKVRTLNEGRNQQGRFLLGHQVVDSFCGGVFIIDVSTAQPFSGVSFILEQLSKVFDYWATETPTGHARPRFNILLCSREVIECWRSSLGTVTTNMDKRLLPWYEDIKYKMPTSPGFNMVKALRTAGTMAKSEVPIFLLCGGLVEMPLNTPSEMSKVLYEMQLACLSSQAPMQPVVAVELFPMPQARIEGLARVKTSAGGDEEVVEKRTIIAPRPDADDVSTVVSVEEAAALGSNIFALLVDSLTAGRIRLLEVFREVDKDGDRALDWQQLYRLVLRLVPDATPAHVRYVQLLLDCTGDNLVRYKDLAAAVRACGRGGISVSLRDKLEVQLVLHKMAIQMLLGRITPPEMFARYDLDHDGFWSEKELANMLKDLFPGLRPAEHQLLFDSWKGVDKNQDGRISLDEFSRAFSSGGVPGLPGSNILAHPDQVQRMKEAGELDDFTIMAMKATEENKRLDRVRAAGFPLSEILVRVAGATRGLHRRLDLGRARAFADRIDLKPLEAVRDAINANLQQLLAFEKAYGKQLTYEFHHGRALRSARVAGSLTLDPPATAAAAAAPNPSSYGRLTRPTNSARARVGGVAGSGSPFAATAGVTAATAADSGVTSASPSRPRSAARSRPLSRPRSAAASATASAAASGGIGRPLSAMASSIGGGSSRGGGGGSTRSAGSRPSSASRPRPQAGGWIGAGTPAAAEPSATSNAGSVSMPPIGRENSASGSQPWHTGAAAAGSGGGASRELSQRSSLLAGLATAGEDDPRLAGRQEYRPPSERSLQRPRASYGSRTPSVGPSAEPSNASLGGAGADSGGGADGSNAAHDDDDAAIVAGSIATGGGNGGSGAGSHAGSRPSSAPSRRRASGMASAAESVSGSVAMPPLAFSRLPSAASTRRSLPLKTAAIGFGADGQDAPGLPFLSPDPNALLPGFGNRPMSAGRRSVGTVGSHASRS